ncbi:MAG: hypothetical protein KDC68_09400, partial [Gelidibacter sp.]|nr:hypothetical protein [Gelidibacter sp.]
MSSIKFKIVCFFFFLLSVHLFAQVKDGEQKSVPIPAEKSKNGQKDSITKPIKIEPKPQPSLSITKNDNVEGTNIKKQFTIKNKKEEFSMFDNSTLINPGQIFEKKWNAKAIEQGFKPETMEDQFLGNFTMVGENANIICRDFEYPDGDRVRVFVNDEVFVPDLLLTSGYKSFKVPLVKGINKIDFYALNQGDSGPNTAEFQVYDDNDVLV